MEYPDGQDNSSRLASLIPEYKSPANRFDEIGSRPPDQLTLWHRILTGQELHKPRQTTTKQLQTGVGTLGSALFSASSNNPPTAKSVVERWRTAKNRLLDFTGGVASDSDSRRPWEVDPIPFILDLDDWQILSRGIAQRAKLLDLILKDIYGPKSLLTKGLIPPELLFGNEAFLTMMQGTARQDRPMISVYAAQLCRDGFGEWFVIADRTQGPSGGGYVVENRIALSKVLPNEFHDLFVQRSAPFFAMLQEAILKNSPVDDGLERDPDARSVLLSPGTKSSTYFEDAYLARYLNYALAQADDLTVRNRRVYLKTLSDLVPVGTMLRRIKDNDCDPLELASSALGIPGLCQASRDGTISIANPLGSGWAEIPALHALLPRLCNELLGEELLLRSWPSWWCGEQGARQYVLSNLNHLVVRDSLTRSTGARWTGVQLSADQRTRSMNAIQKNPSSYVASPPLQFSIAPTWHNQQVVGWPMAMRVFATASDKDFQVLSGGIARVADSPDRLTESLSSGSMSKDVWILGNSPVKPVTLRRPIVTSLEYRRSSYDLPSRVAEHLYWLGRWTERAEGMIRHARCCVNRLTGEVDQELLPVLSVVVDAIEERELHQQPFITEPEALSEYLRRQLTQFIFDASNLNSLAAALVGVRRNATSIRDRLSLDSWQILSQLDLDVLFPQPVEGCQLGDIQILLSDTLDHFTGFAGLVAENMTRGPGWQFLDMGRRIERATNQLRLIESWVVPDYSRQASLMELLLDIMDSSMTYRYRYLSSIEPGPLVDLLIVDQSNPRAAAFQFAQLDEHVKSLAILDPKGLGIQRQQIQNCRATLRLADVDAIVMIDQQSSKSLSLSPEIVSGRLTSSGASRPELRRLITELTGVLGKLADYLGERFFTHTAAARRLGDSATQ